MQLLIGIGRHRPCRAARNRCKVAIKTDLSHSLMKFCSECASPVSLSIPAGDNRPRYVCANCAAIHYQNPKMVLGTIPVWERDGELKILLCKRAIEPRYGY